MTIFKKYTRKGFSEMRPYILDEDLSGVSVADVDIPELGGMIARNPKNHQDQWYVAKQYFEDNLELAEQEKQDERDNVFLCETGINDLLNALRKTKQD